MRLIIHPKQYCRRGDSVNTRPLALGFEEFHGVESLLVPDSTNKNDDEKETRHLRMEVFSFQLYKKVLKRLSDEFGAHLIPFALSEKRKND